MDHFTEALLSTDKSNIPNEYDWFAPLIGDWDFDYYDKYENGEIRLVKGEWMFRRVLDGTGIQDLFICPSRDTMHSNPQPDAEYGMAIRMFNKKDKCYNMSYACEKGITNLTIQKDDNKLIGTVTTKPSQKWVFSDIKADTFHWQNVTVMDHGEWHINCDVYAKRKK